MNNSFDMNFGHLSHCFVGIGRFPHNVGLLPFKKNPLCGEYSCPQLPGWLYCGFLNESVVGILSCQRTIRGLDFFQAMPHLSNFNTRDATPISILQNKALLPYTQRTKATTNPQARMIHLHPSLVIRDLATLNPPQNTLHWIFSISSVHCNNLYT